MQGSGKRSGLALRNPNLWRDAAAMALCVAGLIVVVLALPILPLSRAWGFDFTAYYGAALRLAETGTPYLPVTLAGPFSPGPAGLYLYSPVPALLALPMTLLDEAAATDLWLWMRVGLLIAGALLMPISWRLRVAMVGISGLSLMVLIDLALGNVSLVMTFLTIVAWRFLDRPAGAIAVASSLFARPTMGLILVWWAVRRRWRPLGWAIAGVAVIVLLSLPLIGAAPYFDYVTVLRNLGVVTGVPNNVDLASIAHGLGAPPPVVTAALLATYGTAAAASLLSLRRDRELSFVVVSMAVLFASPLLWDHYLTQLLIPAAFLAGRGRTWGLALPLLLWVPALGMTWALPLLGLAAMLLPFAAPRRGEPAMAGWRRRHGASETAG
jgi:alpha-1,2-mannosyltransferase